MIVLMLAIGEGFWSKIYPNSETAKKTAVRWMKELVRRATEAAGTAE